MSDLSKPHPMTDLKAAAEAAKAAGNNPWVTVHGHAGAQKKVPSAAETIALAEFQRAATPDAILALIRERDEALAALNHAKLCVRQIEISAGAINGFASQIKAFPATLTQEPHHG